MKNIHIGIIGDFNANNPTHTATNEALQHAAVTLDVTVDARWIPTDEITGLSNFDGIIASPGSPYRSLDGALHGIRFAREHGVPFLGTCGGFQHLILEYARNVLGVVDAAHAEYDPDASVLFLTRLACSLVGKTMTVDLAPGSVARAAYTSNRAEESYYCNFGLNPEFRKPLEDRGLAVSGADQDGEVRIVEIPSHPFFVGTLFVPQTRSTMDKPHPLLVQFLRVATRVWP